MSDYYSSSDEDEGDYFVECQICDCHVKARNYDRHLNNVHKCKYCPNYMPKESLQSHIERKHIQRCRYCTVTLLEELMAQHESTHFVKCKYCVDKVLDQNLNEHVTKEHPFHATIGMLRMDKTNDQEFNRLIKENRIYAKDGHIFIQ